MKTHFINYLLNVLIAGVLLLLGNFIITQVKEVYYTYADISNFYVAVEFNASDICTGDLTQNVQSIRHVKGTVTGYKAIVVRELGQINDDTFIKIHEEKVEPFVEYIPDGISYRVQRLPFELKEGNYQWVLYPTIFVNGVLRSDVPPIESNIFKVIDC